MKLVKVLLVVPFAVLTFVSLRHAGAAEDAVVDTVNPDQVVGNIYGKEVTAGDIQLTKPIDVSKRFDASDTAEWEQMGRILVAFGKPISDRFKEEEKIEVSEEEVQRFKEGSKAAAQRAAEKNAARRDEIEKKLAAGTLSEADKAKLVKERDLINNVLPGMQARKDKEVPDGMAHYMILPWKVEHALHKRYGGRVIFQQFGPEALDARRQLFEGAEKRGDLKFTDPGVRHLFYYYYRNMKHVVTDENVLDKPWWERTEE